KSGGVARTWPATAVAPVDRRKGKLTRPPADRSAILDVRGLETHFTIGREVYRAVGGVDFVVRPGEAVGIVGGSGSGQTVAALSVLRLVAPPPGMIVGGEVLYRGEDMAEASLGRLQEVRGDRVAYVFQDPLTTLNPLIPVGEQIAESLRRHRGLGRAEATR